MKKAKIIGLVLIVLIAAFALSCSKDEEAAEAPAAAEKEAAPALPGEGMIAAMATDVGGLGDKSFNDGAYGGLKMAEEKLGTEARVVQSKQQTDYVPEPFRSCRRRSRCCICSRIPDGSGCK